MPKHIRKKNVELNYAIIEHSHPTSIPSDDQEEEQVKQTDVMDE